MKRLIYSFILVCVAQVAIGQDFDRYFYASWDYNIPLSSKNWVEDPTARGFKIGYRKMITNRISLGGDVTWAVFDQYEPTTTFIADDGAITTDYFKYVYSYGLTLNGQYFLPVNNQKVLPFIGIGVGAALNRYTLYYNFYTEEDSNWGFRARPEVGVLFAFGGKVGATVGAHYDYTTAKSDYFSLSDFNHYGFNVGIVLMSY